MRAGAGRMSALGALSALPESHRKMGVFASCQWCTCASHTTALGTARTLRWRWGLWREAKDARLWQRQGSLQAKAYLIQSLLSKFPAGEPGAWTTQSPLARAVQGKWRRSSKRCGNRWSGSKRRRDCPPSSVNSRWLGQEPRSPGPRLHSTTSKKKHSPFQVHVRSYSLS